ncbi:MAG: ribosome silencing factor [Leptospiraceae bacterium]|nr:ribosome silencing factor [Leptospiraceae bacterium]MCP5499760.1 ribosome silencing factor [Leptospiraceae bacterium]
MQADINLVLKDIVDILNNKKCEDISILDLESVNSYLSLFVICTVKTGTQGKAVSKDLLRSLKKYKLTRGTAGKTDNTGDSGWILIDFGEVFVHIMTKEIREYYNLDKLWGDAKHIPLPVN